MKIELTKYKENEDGGADFHVDMDQEATRFIINYGLINMLRDAVEKGKEYTPSMINEKEEEEEEAEEEEEKDVVQYVALECEQIDAIMIKELQNCLVNTYKNSFLFSEDVDNNIHIRNACKTLLGFYMIPSEAKSFLNRIALTYEC